MAEENSYPNLEGKRVSTTFRGLLHFPHSLDSIGSKEVVYDGQGKATALTLGTNELDVNGSLDVMGSLNVTGQTQINSNNNALILLGNANDTTGFYISKSNISNKFEIGSNPYSSSSINTKFCISSAGYIGVGTTNATEKLQVEGTVKSHKNKIISPTEDHELLYGSDNLFSIIVKKDGDNNFYIKKNYNDPDINSPLWINRQTGEVNIRKLNVVNIKSINDPTDTSPSPNRPDRNSNVLPVGMVCMFPALNDVPGWHICDGSPKQWETYPELAAFLGTTYGGSQDLWFNVPDYREVFLRGWGTSSGRRNYDPLVTSLSSRPPGPNIQTDAMQPITGSFGADDRMDNSGIVAGAFTVGANGRFGQQGDRETGIAIMFDSTNSEGVRTSKETRPVNMAVAYYIKW